jgi:hypothetical protein
VLNQLNFNTDYFIVIDDEDNCIDEYRKVYDDKLLIFNKSKYIDSTETIIYPKNDCSAVYVKNFIEDFCFKKQMDAFIIIDDDMRSLRYRYELDGSVKSQKLTDINKIFQQYVDYMIECDIDGLCFGMHTMYLKKPLVPNERRFMSNIYIRNCRKRKMNWVSQIFDDFNSCISLANSGYIFLMLPFIQMEFEPQYFQIQNKKSDQFRCGGLVSLYDSYDSFKRAFVSTIIHPSGCKPYLNNQVYMMSTKNNNTFPKILSSEFKKCT